MKLFGGWVKKGELFGFINDLQVNKEMCFIYVKEDVYMIGYNNFMVVSQGDVLFYLVF